MFLCCITCFSRLFVEIIVTNCVADAQRVFEQRASGIETFAGYLGDRAVEFHLAVNFVAGTPRRGFLEATETERSQANVQFTLAICDL